MSYKEFTAEAVPTDGTQLTSGNEGAGSGDPIATVKSASGGSITGTATNGQVIHGNRSVVLGAPAAGYAYLSWPETGLTAVGFRSYITLSTTSANYTVTAFSNGSTYVAKVILLTTGQLLIQDSSKTLLTTSALTLPGTYGIDIAMQVGTTTSNGSVKFALYDMSGNPAGGVTTPFENTACNTGTTAITSLNTGKIDSGGGALTLFADSIKRIDSYALLGIYSPPPPLVASINESPQTSLQATAQRTLTANVTSGSPTIYEWTQTAGPTVTFSGASAASASYAVPPLTATTNVTVQLRVSDGTNWSTPVTLTDTIKQYPIWYMKNGTLTAGTIKHAQSSGGGGSTNPIADAGSLPIGSANYAVPQNAIFVASTGSDSAAGTQAAPLATLAKAVSVASSGGTIVMRAGVYNEGTDTQGGSFTLGIIMANPVTIQNYPGEAVWLDGSAPITGAWTAGSGTWSIPYTQLYDRSPTFTSGAADGTPSGGGGQGQFIDPNYPCAAWPDMILYDGTQLTQVDSLAKVTSGTFFVDGATTSGFWFQATTLYIGDNPSGHQLRYANKTRLCAVTGSNVTIRGVGIRRYASSQPGVGALYLSGTSATLENVQIQDISCAAMWLASKPNITLTKVTSRNTGFNVIGGNQADNILLDRVDFQQANTANFYTSGPALGIVKVTKLQGIVVKNSILANSNCHGFWTDQTVNNPYVYSSVIHDLTGGRAVDFELSSNAILANCNIYNIDGDGVFINDSDQVRIWNCTITNVNRTSGTAYVDVGQSSRRYNIAADSYGLDNRQPNSYYTGDPSHQWQNNGFQVYNTVMARPNNVGRGMFDCESAQDTSRPSGVFQPDFNPQMDSNVYYWVTQPQYPFVTTLGYNTNPKVYFSSSAFHTGTGLETNSTFVSTNPLNASYDLVDSSIHAKGTALPSDIATLIGQTVGTKHVGIFF